MIPGLDGLRGIAYLLIFLFHSDYLGIGWVGVQFFFVLSGFLITGILLRMKKNTPTGKYFFLFYGRRFLRIFPLYYLYLFLMSGLAVYLLSIHYRPALMRIFEDQTKYAIYYIYNLFASTIYNQRSFFLDHLWSLSVEEQFYIVWPLLIFFIPEKYQKTLFISFIAAGPLFRIFFHFIYLTGEFRIFLPDLSEALYPLPLTHMDAFAFGAYISRYSIPKIRQQFISLAILTPLIGFATQYMATGSIGSLSNFGYPLHMPDAYQYIWGYSLLNYFFATTIQMVVQNGLFGKFLEWSPIKFLGKISYGLYVYHHPVIWFAFRIQDTSFITENTVKPIATILAFFVTLFIAIISYFLLEKPLLRQKDIFFPMESNAK